MQYVVVPGGISPGEAFRLTEDLSKEDKDKWAESERLHDQQLLARALRRDAGQTALTEQQVDDSLAELAEIRRQRTRPADFSGDLSASAPPVVIDGDDADERRDADEYANRLYSITPHEKLVPATLAQVLANNPFGPVCLTGCAHDAHAALMLISQRLRSAQLSCTAYADPGELCKRVGLLAHVSSTDTLHVFAVHSRYAVTCRLGPGQGGLVVNAYCFTCAD